MQPLVGTQGIYRLLVVEDNDINAAVVLDMLQEGGPWHAERAENGRVAVACARRNAYDLILMDMQMPELDGLEASRQIRALPGHAQTPIIAMTANAFAEDRQACLAAGMNDHLAKPFSPEALFGKIARCLCGRSPRMPQLPAVPPATELPLGELAADALPTATPEAWQARLAQVRGLDLEQGLQSVRQRNLEKYLQLLRKSLAHCESPAAWRPLLAAGDWPALRQRAHSLKGVAATLGLRAVQNAVETLAGELQAAEPAASAALEALILAYDRSFSDLKMLFATDETKDHP